MIPPVLGFASKLSIRAAKDTRGCLPGANYQVEEVLDGDQAPELPLNGSENGQLDDPTDSAPLSPLISPTIFACNSQLGLTHPGKAHERLRRVV